jgi:hypothetical protein
MMGALAARERTGFPEVESLFVWVARERRLQDYFRREGLLMRSVSRNFAVAVLAIALAGPVFIAGCEGEVRYYDADYHDYHRWNHGEVVYYSNWEHETHREHVDFAKRNDAEKKEYFAWRHNKH